MEIKMRENLFLLIYAIDICLNVFSCMYVIRILICSINDETYYMALYLNLQFLKSCSPCSLTVCLSVGPQDKRTDLWNDEGSIGCIPGLKNLIPSCLKFHHHCLPFNHVLLLNPYFHPDCLF